jgi:hypothetical protein
VDAFWELAAQKGATAICNSDAHEPEYVIRGVLNARAYAARFVKHNLNVAETINLSEGR